MVMSHEGATLKIGSASVIADPPRREPPPSVGPDEPAALAIRLSLFNGEQRLRQNDPAARQGNVDGVHRMRTAARRLRSELRLCRALLEGDWGERLAAELKWLGRLLGLVRDPDVMRER